MYLENIYFFCFHQLFFFPLPPPAANTKILSSNFIIKFLYSPLEGGRENKKLFTKKKVFLNLNWMNKVKLSIVYKGNIMVFHNL